MKTLEQCLREAAPAPMPLPDRPGLTTNYTGPGLLPRGDEAFDWRVVAGRMMVAADREAQIARGLTDPMEKARREARADVWLTAAANVREEATRKGLA